MGQIRLNQSSQLPPKNPKIKKSRQGLQQRELLEIEYGTRANLSHFSAAGCVIAANSPFYLFIV